MILDDIIKKSKEDLKKMMSIISFDNLGKSLSYNSYMPKDVISAIKSSEDEPIKIIAQIQENKPNGKVIKQNFFPAELAYLFNENGANAISVVTEQNFFKAQIEYLAEVRRYCNIPILRKDFIFDKYQILESLVYGADFIVLMPKILEKKELKELLEFTYHVGLQVLVECESSDDIKKAIFSGADIIGLNNLDLDSLKRDEQLYKNLLPIIPNSKIIVADIEYNNHDELVELNKKGVDSFIISDFLLNQDDIGLALKNIKER